MKVEYKFFPFFNYMKDCKLSYTSKLIYSYLSYRDRITLKTKPSQLKKKFHLRRDLSDSIKELIKFNLITTKEKILQPIEPSDAHENWIKLSKKENLGHWSLNYMSFKHWIKKVKYDKHHIHLTNKQVTILSILEDFKRQNLPISFQGLGTILSLDWKTIRDAMFLFQDMEFFNIFRYTEGKNEGKYLIEYHQAIHRNKTYQFQVKEIPWENENNPSYINRLLFENVTEEQLARIKRLASDLESLTKASNHDLNNIMLKAIEDYDPVNFYNWIPLFEKILENWVNDLTKTIV